MSSVTQEWRPSEGGAMIRVLLVDDNTQYVRVFSLTLDWQPDIEVVGIAGTLAEARAMLEDVDVAILDRMLPDGDGLGLISELREASPGVKVLVMSAFAEMANPPEALEAGADRVLAKVVPPDEVFATIRELRGEQTTSKHRSS
jgi:DNA-binding NarL/FixJ family response regulator